MDVVGIGIVITPVACGVPSRAADVPGLSGTSIARPAPGTLLERLCGTGDLRGEYFCNFEANPDFVSRWQEAGLRVAARGADGEMRALELPDKRFFVATLFQPQLSSSYGDAHPIVVGYLRACMAQRGAAWRPPGDEQADS